MKEPFQRNLARFISGCRLEKVPEALRHDARLRILDWLGCAAAGADYPQTRIARAWALEQGGSEQSCAVGLARRVPARTAAFVNGIAGHVCELDDGHRTAIGHAGSVTLPGTLALAEHLGSSGAELLRAVIVGYDLFARIGRTVNPSHYRTWHTTGTVGTIAAAGAAAALLGLDEERTGNALGLACTMAGGLIASFGTHAKAVNIAAACQNGVDAALLARQGLTAAQDALEAPKGFVAATCVDPHWENLRDLSEENLQSATAFFKKYSSCGHTNSPLDALCELLSAHPEVRGADVASVTVRTYRTSVEITGRLACATEDEAKFSLPYCIAVRILRGSVGLRQFAPDVRSDPEVLGLARRVEVLESPEATAAFPKRRAEVTVRLADGRELRAFRPGADDAVTDEMVLSKFRDAAGFLGDPLCAETIEAAQRVETLPECSAFLRFLRAAGETCRS